MILEDIRRSLIFYFDYKEAKEKFKQNLHDSIKNDLQPKIAWKRRETLI